ncbi:MvaI/BcnI family restriction endonuclease [Mariniblastus fucicola]|uniref:MvaI/BcnI restriction endonuclease domain-containing protein n=1 Tax=Mariniblastus fucicola TaxID=980251 RepID=A0A5B9P870_9BACT|nr:MvaI/BcnI family restriction endonuclease [Mariniblastus fucicola]QEG20816.1 hypothetical protein MFFC18_06670 [Mariniblastus fucicola]
MTKSRIILFLTLLAAAVSGCDPVETPPSPRPDPAPTVVKSPVEILAEESVAPTVSPPAETTPDIASGTSEFDRSPAVDSFLEKFDMLSEQGFVPTLRRGSTGIGYTLETMLGIEENNSPGGDYMGMELKAFRDDDLTMNDSEKMNLFLKEPKWTDGLKSADRVRNYGYVDDNGRTALYSTVTIDMSSHKFAFEVEGDSSKVWLTFDGSRIAFWTREILAKRLKEKHTETVFVSAHSRGKGKAEEFHYYGVTWCREPSVDEFIKLLRKGDVMLELRMHLKESGAVRNHGSCFRIKQNRIRDLFRYAIQVRP